MGVIVHVTIFSSSGHHHCHGLGAQSSTQPLPDWILKFHKSDVFSKHIQGVQRGGDRLTESFVITARCYDTEQCKNFILKSSVTSLISICTCPVDC